MFFAILTILAPFGCDQPSPADKSLPSDPTNKLTEARTYTGSIIDQPPCGHTINIDVIEAGVDKPIVYTHANEDGKFTINIPSRIWDTPLSIHGFCYASPVDLRDNVVQWKTEPFLLLPMESISISIELHLESTQNAVPTNPKHTEPAIQESIPTEYSTWVQNPLLLEYYGLRFPDHKLTSSGSLPEIRQGGLTATMRKTHLFATLDFIRSNSEPSNYLLLLPSKEQLEQVRSVVDPTSIAFDVIETQINIACEALNLFCPSVNLLRQQEWVLKDKRPVDNVELTQKRAYLWLLGHHLIQKFQTQRTEIPSNIPLPKDLREIEDANDATKVYQRWVALYAEYNVSLPAWNVEP